MKQLIEQLNAEGWIFNRRNNKTTKNKKRSQKPPFLEWYANTGTGRRGNYLTRCACERINKIVTAFPGKRLLTRNRTAAEEKGNSMDYKNLIIKALDTLDEVRIKNIYYFIFGMKKRN